MKFLKMSAIALMALALFSCKKEGPQSAENAVLSIRISDSELRAIEDAIADGTKTVITSDVVLTLSNGQKITLSDQQITEAKSATGTSIAVKDVIATVAMTANGTVADNTEITTLQGKAATFTTEIPLAAPATNTTTTQDASGNTVYSVTLKPVPAMARLEISGKIVPPALYAGDPKNERQAFEDIKVEAVYMNNYLLTPKAATRYMTGANTTLNGFAADPALKAEMYDEIADADQAGFEAKTKVAGYQLFPKKADETAAAPDYFDHVVLKLSVQYAQDAIDAAGYPATPVTRYVTIARFMKEATGDLDGGFEAGKIYKLDLNELSEAFKTTGDGTPDPENPDTTEPEPAGKKLLNVKVEPFTWTAVNIKPDVNGGYKK